MRGAFGVSVTQILMFQVQEQRFGLSVADVQELQRVVTIVPLPKAPAVVEGLIDLRGTLVPVFDIRCRFRLLAKEVGPLDHLVIAHAKGRLVALRVDRVLDLVEVDDREIEDPRDLVPGTDYVAGVARLEGGLVLIHDLATFLSAAEAAELDAAIAEGAR
jgi:purine-binding chemotaxis protein CheW